MKTHELKTWPSYFHAVWEENKLFEVRKNDRQFHTGDILLLREFDPEIGIYTGREIFTEVTYTLRGGRLGIDFDYCVMSLKILKKEWRIKRDR